MNTGVGRARLGQWYVRWDNGELFQVTGYDDDSRALEVQSFDGDLYEIENRTWRALPLGLAEPPEGWTELADTEKDDLGYSEVRGTRTDWAMRGGPLEIPVTESSANTGSEEEAEAADFSTAALAEDAEASIHYHYRASE